MRRDQNLSCDRRKNVEGLPLASQVKNPDLFRQAGVLILFTGNWRWARRRLDQRLLEILDGKGRHRAKE
jgi:hypothetical protein